VKNGNFALTKFLLENGANVNSHKDYLKETSPLYLAIKDCKIDIVKLLLENGANPNILVAKKNHFSFNLFSITKRSLYHFKTKIVFYLNYKCYLKKNKDKIRDKQKVLKISKYLRKIKNSLSLKFSSLAF
jgi:hypothetical protein